MQRSSSDCGGPYWAERGMVSALFFLVAVPLLMVFLCVGLELTHFFGTHDDIQRIVDRETRSSITKGLSAADTERAVRSQLGRFEGLISVESVRSVKTPQWSDTRVQATFRGLFSELALRLAGASAPRLPMHVSARARRVVARTLIVLDRSLQREGRLCGDPALGAQAAFIDALAAALSKDGIAGISLAIIPGSRGAVELLGAAGTEDLFARCRPRRAELPFDADSLAGAYEAHDPLAVALGTAAIVDEELLLQTAEIRSVVIVQSGAVAAARGYAEPLMTMLDAYARDRMARVSVVHVVLDAQGFQKLELPPPGPFGVDLRSVVTTQRELAHPNLLVAMKGRISERSVLVF